jgi:hypothetical protein
MQRDKKVHKSNLKKFKIKILITGLIIPKKKKKKRKSK